MEKTELRFPNRTIQEVLNGHLEQLIIERKMMELDGDDYRLMTTYHQDGADVVFTIQKKSCVDRRYEFLITSEKVH